MSGDKRQTKKRFRPSIDDRLLAVGMLATAPSIESVVDKLVPKHPKYTRDEVQAGYFPARGVFFISNLLGASEDIVDLAKQKIARAHKKYADRGRRMFQELWKDEGFASQTADFGRANLSRINQDPVFVAQRAQRNRDRLKVLHKDPLFAAQRDKVATARIIVVNKSVEGRERARRKMGQWNKDAEFQAKAHAARWTPENRAIECARMLARRQDPQQEQARLVGLDAYWDEYRRIKAVGLRAYLDDAGVSIIRRAPNGYLALGDLRYLPDSNIVLKQRYEMLHEALNTLEEHEQRVIRGVFFTDYQDEVSMSDVAGILEMPMSEIEGAYNSALSRLRSHEGLLQAI